MGLLSVKGVQRFSPTVLHREQWTPAPKHWALQSAVTMCPSHSYRKPQPILLAAAGNLPWGAESSSSPLGAAASCCLPHEFLLWRQTKNASGAKPLPHSFCCHSPEAAELLEWCFSQPVGSTNSVFLLSISHLCSFPRVWGETCEVTSTLHTQHLLLSLQPAPLCLLFGLGFCFVFQLFSLLVAKSVLASSPSLPLCAWTQPASFWSC